MKQSGTAHWEYPNKGATNESGFTALPGGDRYVDGSFRAKGYQIGFWSTSQYDLVHGIDRRLFYDNMGVRRGSPNKGHGYSVRCVKD